MEQEEQRNFIWDWLERRTAGRMLLAGWAQVRRCHDRHVERYRRWDEVVYRRCTWLAVALILMLVALALAGSTRFVLYQYRCHQENRAEAAARQFIARGDYHNASLSARLALRLNPHNVSAGRTMAEVADHFHSPATLVWLQRVEQDEPTVANQLILASAGLNYQKPPFPITVTILKQLAPIAARSASYQVVAASLAMNTGHLPEAEARFANAFKLEPTNQLFKASVAILQMALTNQAEQVQNRATLEQLRKNGGLALLVLRALVEDRLLHQDAAGALAYSGQLVANPQAALSDQLQNLAILQHLKSDDLALRLQAVQEQVATNATGVAEVSAWMQMNGLLSESLDWLTDLPVAMLDKQPVQMALAQGYLQSANWPSLRDTASRGNWGTLEFLRFALVFRAWSQLGAESVADSNWSAAMGEAANRPEAMAKLLELAENWHLKHEREDLLQQMVQESPHQPWARQKLEQLYFDSGNTLGLHELYAILNARSPDDITVKNDLAATALLLKIDLREACHAAAAAYAADPTNPTEASTYAFALHLQGRDKQGLAVLKSLSPAELSQPSVALYYGVLLAATGKTAQATSWLQIAQSKGRLLPEEQQLLATALEMTKIK